MMQFRRPSSELIHNLYFFSWKNVNVAITAKICFVEIHPVLRAHHDQNIKSWCYSACWKIVTAPYKAFSLGAYPFLFPSIAFTSLQISTIVLNLFMLQQAFGLMTTKRYLDSGKKKNKFLIA